MKKPAFLNSALVVLLLLLSLQLFAQNHVPFTPRFNQDLKGDILLIGNNILGPDNNAFNNDFQYNHRVNMIYIDIDGDASTFNSTSADLQIPNPNCYKIIHAGLYWGAVTSGPEPITNVKFKGPSGGYNDVVGTVIFNANGTSVDGGNSFPYSCYADVTSIVTSLATTLGTFTVGNVSSAQGKTEDFSPYNGTGYSAGWSLFVVYEDPTLPGKSITSFDGFSAISFANNPSLDIPVSGFRTIPAPAPVRANFAFATLEGDKPITNDRLKINGINLSAADRPVSNFFNSSVTQLSAMPVTNRNPNSTNTLGFDTGIMVVPNPGNTVIANDATSATVRLETSGDTYFQYFFALAVEIIEPKIVLTKQVEDALGNDIGGQLVSLGQQLNYVIGFQNTGNDDATNFTVRDILPINVVFDYPSDLDILPAGVTVESYNAATREIVFRIDDAVVEENDPVLEIRFKVTVVESCNLLNDLCNNNIDNQAFATYNGTLNPTFTISDDPSFSSNTGCLLTPQATNFLADVNDCIFTENMVLCGANVVLTAANGYDSYSWSTSPTGSPVIGTTQSITVTNVGTYYVDNTVAAPCQSINQEFTVTFFNGNVTNPVIPYADQVVTCPNDGKLLPNIFLCGANDSRFIQTNISDTQSMIWEKLDEASCTAVINLDCANENTSCIWNQVATGSDFIADTSGQYRLTLNYSGGCFNQFYFNVYENLLAPTVTSRDIICNTLGEIVVGGVSSGYEYSIDGTTYQSSNVFSITTAGIYTVYIRQVGVVSNPCIFTVPNVQIRERDFTVSSFITQPFCNGDKGSIKLAANDVRPQYFYSIYQGGTLINSVGPIIESDYTFADLNAGTYTVNVSTEDGCTYTGDVTIVGPPLLWATSALTKPLTCTDGEITVYPVGGTPPYFYFVNSTTVFQNTPQISVTSPGVYNIMVVDSNNCSANTSITVNATLAPDFNITKTDNLCANTGDNGTISINVTNTNGNSLQYSIDNGVTFFNSPLFTGLSAGDYDVVVQYTTGTDVCVSAPQTITIAGPTAITGIATLTTPYTCITNGTITVSGVSGGTPPYTYSIDGIIFQAGTTFTGLTDGTYTVTIKDANDCTFITTSVTIDPLNPPTDMIFSSMPLTCPTNVSTVTITGTTGGTGTLEYQIIAPAASVTGYQTSTTFSGLAPDTYTFQVRDANDCTYNESYTIAPLPSITVVGQLISDVTCFEASDGSVRFTVSGSTGFTYTINGGASTAGTSPINLSGLVAGSYTILITDTTTNCQETATVTVNEPVVALSVITSVTPITCNTNGSVVINATGGWGGYAYSLTQPDTTILPAQGSNIFVNLTQTGMYTVSVTDANGCVATGTFTLSSSTNPIATIDVTSDFCYDATNGSTLEVNASGGQPPYEYNINGGAFGSSNIFTNLIPENYTITVRDAYGCTVTLPTETIAPQLLLSTVLTKDLDCTVSPDVIITGNISGGYAPFTYEVSINGSAYSPLETTVSPFSYTTAIAGVHQFQITDARGCTVQSVVSFVNAISLPEIISVTQTQDILCNGDSNGAIQVIINNAVGTPPFVINVNNDSTGVNYGTQTTSLSAGNYTVTITDSKSCTDTKTITIAEPNPIVVIYHSVDITCDPILGESKGSVIIDGVTGGTAPYNYFVTGINGYNASELNAMGSTSVTFDVVDFGLYQINVVDANGCSVLIQDVLVASPPDDLDILINTTADCISGGSALIAIGTTLASSGPFHFAIYTGQGMTYIAPTAFPWQDEDAIGSKKTTFTNLIPGVTYTFIVFDESTGCYYFETSTAPIPTNSTLTTSALSSNNITCKGSADGNVSFTVNSIYSSPTNINYEIFNSQSVTTTGITGSGMVPANGTFTVSNLGLLTFGNYFVLITETSGPNAGCSVVTVPFNITESAIDLSITATVDKNANCNSNSGVISAIATDGTAPYLYQITTSSIAPLATDPFWTSTNTFNVNANSYYVHSMDAYGCIKSTPVLVLPLDPEPVITASLSNQCTATEGNFEIDVTLTSIGIVPYSFSIDGGALQTLTIPFTISNLSSGSHTVEVQDANGCGNLVTVNIDPSLGLTPAITALPTCTDNDGEITVDGFGGTGTYSYNISPNPASITLAGNVYSGVPSGTYTITITDTTTLCTADVAVTLDAATPVTFTTSDTSVSCNGGSNGSITVNLPAGNNNPPYTYEITAPIVIAAQSSNIFTGLAAGMYTVQVNSGRGCSSSVDVPIGEPALLTNSGTATPFACAPDNSVNTSTLTISEVGGTAPYTYSIEGVNYFSSNTFEIIDTGVTQTIDIFVTDTNGCKTQSTVTIAPLPALTAAASIATPIDCNNTGTVTISVTGGSGNFSYQMLPDGTPQASNIFSISVPGDYYFQVNDLDTGCTIAASPYTVAPFDIIDVVSTATTAITCFGDSNGEFEINVSGYTGSYNYEVFDSLGNTVTGIVSANTLTNPQIINGMSAGNYTIVITETASPFCSTTSNVVTIDSPAILLSLTATETSNVTCDNNRGTITAVVNGGWGSYEYELTGAATVAYSPNGTFTGLSGGVYVVNVRDAGGCIVSDGVTLEIPIPLDATVIPSTTLLSCFGDTNATITVSNVTGGQGGNYSYTLNTILPVVSSSGPQSSPVFDGLGAGTYSVDVTDGYNCILPLATIVITEPTQIQVDLVKESSQTCLTGTTLTLSATGGTGSYTYSDDSSFTTVLGSFASSVTFSVPDGAHTYYVRDANGCITNVSNQIQIDPLLPLVINLDTTNSSINCSGESTGVLVATAQGALGNYIYTLQDDSGNDIPGATQDSPGVFTGLSAGIYQVYTTSGDCDETLAAVAITEPSLPLIANYTTTDVSCNGGNDGILEINASGGSGIIKYAISPQMDQFFEEPIFDNLAPGDYQVIVQDELGCYELFDFTINEPVPVMLSIVPNSIIPEVCSGDMDGEFSIEISGGSLPYRVSLDDINGPYTTGTATQTQFVFTELSGGDHLVYIRDGQGCESEWNITFPESVTINPQVIVEYGCTGNTSTNTITVIVDDSITDPSDLDYSLDSGPYQASNVFTNVAPGVDHFIDVRHTNSCIQRTENFEAVQFEPLELVLEERVLNEIVAIAIGGSGIYEYTLNSEYYGSNNTFIIYESGDYIITVTDSNGCVASATIYLEYVDVCISNYFTPNGDGLLDEWGPGCTAQYQNLKFNIYDRYGRTVASLRAGQKWDGKYNGNELPTGDYWYVVKLNDKIDNRHFVGHFTLYR